MSYSTPKKQQIQPDNFKEEVLQALASPNPYISPRWLYDAAGSALFERIKDLPEYYVTRTEMALMDTVIGGFAERIGSGASLVEYGAGGAGKARVVLDALDQPSEYVAIDISFDHLASSLEKLAHDYPELVVRPLAGDFIAGVLSTRLQEGCRPVGFFPGSTIGNLCDHEVSEFLSGARRFLGDDAYFILGTDLQKPLDVLIAAYDDDQGVTAAFNKNLLIRINRELSGTIDVSGFAHKAVWNDADSRIEMHLQALKDQECTIAGEKFYFKAGDSIHTENSRKFNPASIQKMAEDNGWSLEAIETDENDYFALSLLKAA